MPIKSFGIKGMFSLETVFFNWANTQTETKFQKLTSRSRVRCWPKVFKAWPRPFWNFRIFISVWVMTVKKLVLLPCPKGVVYNIMQKSFNSFFYCTCVFMTIFLNLMYSVICKNGFLFLLLKLYRGLKIILA